MGGRILEVDGCCFPVQTCLFFSQMEDMNDIHTQINCVGPLGSFGVLPWEEGGRGGVPVLAKDKISLCATKTMTSVIRHVPPPPPLPPPLPRAWLDGGFFVRVKCVAFTWACFPAQNWLFCSWYV